MEAYEGFSREELVARLSLAEQQLAELTFSSKFDKSKNSKNRYLDVPMLLISPEWKIFYVNSVLLRLNGFQEHELLGHKISDFVEDENKEWDSEMFGKMLNDECDTFRGEHRFRACNGETLFLDVIAIAVRDGEGNFRHAAYIFNDISEAKRQEQKLTDLLDTQKRVSNSLMLMMKKETGNYENDILKIVQERYNADRAYIFKFDWIENTCSNVYEVNAPGIAPQIDFLQQLPNHVLQGAIDLFRQNKPFIIDALEEYDVKGVDKTVLETQNIQSSIMFPIFISGELWGYLGLDMVREKKSWSDEEILWLDSFTNVFIVGLSQKLMQDELKYQKEMFDLILDSGSLGYWTFDSKTEKLGFSESYMAMFGYEFREKKYSIAILENITHPDDLDGFRSFVSQMATGNIQNPSFEFRIKNSAKEWIWILSKIIKADYNQYTKSYTITGINININDVKKATQEVLEKEDQIIQNEYKYTKLFQNMNLGYAHCRICYDDEGNAIDFSYIDMNLVLEQMLRLPRAECIGKRAGQIKEVSPEQLALFWEVSNDGISRHQEFYSDYYGGWYDMAVYSPRKDEVVVLLSNISDRYKAHELVRKNELKLRTIFENLPVGIVSYDAKGDFVDSNEEMIHILRLNNKNEIDGKNILEQLTHLDWEDQDVHSIDIVYDVSSQKVLNNPEDWISENTRYLLIKIIHLRDEDGSDNGFLLITVDNTEMQQVYQRIKDKDLAWSQIAGLSKIFNWQYNLKTGTYLMISDEIYSYFDADPEEISKVDLMCLYNSRIVPRDQEMLIKKWKDSSIGQENMLSEISFRIDAEGYQSYNTARWVRKKEKGMDILYGITVDITGMMRAERSVQENLVRLSLVMEVGNIAPWYLDLQTGIIELGPEFYMLFDKNEDDFKNYRASDFIQNVHPEDADRFMQEFEKLQSGLIERLIFELRINLGNGYVWCELNGAVRERGVHSEIIKLLGFITIIQKRKDTEFKLIEALEKAEESDRLKSAFLANVSHEIRTPLNAIVGFSEIIATSEDMDEKQYFLNIVKINNNLLLNLINDILDLSKIESGRIDLQESRVDVRKLCRELCDIHQLRAGKSVQIVCDPDMKSLILFTDQNRLHQIYSNLINNAIKYTKSGCITIGYKHKQDWVEFKVRDTGVGIPADKIEFVFNRFEKLNSTKQGFGLGLSICKSLLERMGGTISVKSQVGVGTEFTFTLPYRRAQEDVMNVENLAENQQPDVSNRSEYTILVAEDVDCNYLLIENLLGKNHRLIRAHNGVEAVTLFSSESPDIIIMDMMMPEINGIEATLIIREVSPEIPIIAVSAFAYNSDRDEALAAGCNEYLTKPIESDILLGLLDKYMN